MFSEIQRVLSDGGHLLVAFQAGDGEAVHPTDAYGTGNSLTNFRHCPEEVARSLVEAGLEPNVQAVRDPELAHESNPQTFIIARTVEPGR